MSTDLGGLYAGARIRITEMVESMPPGATDQICPATPDWTVHDVLAHLRGSTEDVRTGNLDGVTTDPWTNAQIERHRQTSVAELLSGWADDSPLLEMVLGMPDPGMATRAVFDVHAHEADLRSALGQPSALPDEFSQWALPLIAAGFIEKVRAAGIPGVQIKTIEGDQIGPTDAPTVLRVSRFELFRALLGRRSAAQAMAYDWGGADAASYVRHLFVFGPRTADLVE